MQNGRVESFHGRLREECLNLSCFQNLLDARRKITAWRKEYNEERPHSSHGYKTTKEFAAQAASFYRVELGQEASNAGPCPRPHPRSNREWNRKSLVVFSSDRKPGAGQEYQLLLS
jgi:hypothetical protein